jgi:hypothetical protein
MASIIALLPKLGLDDEHAFSMASIIALLPKVGLDDEHGVRLNAVGH